MLSHNLLLVEKNCLCKGLGVAMNVYVVNHVDKTYSGEKGTKNTSMLSIVIVVI